jgi:hypothetical protein
MNRIVVLVVVGLLVVAAGGFALKSTPDFAIGAELTTINFVTGGAMLNLHIPKVPLYFGLGANFFGDLPGGFELAATVDYWLLHKPIGSGYFSWYLGLGAYGALAFDPSSFSLGVRLPIALQIWPLKNERLELFLEGAPAWVPVTGGGFEAGNFQAQVALGFRLWSERG